MMAATSCLMISGMSAALSRWALRQISTGILRLPRAVSSCANLITPWTMRFPPIRLFQFAPLKVSAMDEAGSITMDQAIEDLRMRPNEAAICKIDIEGDEWPVLEAAEIEQLARCSQIICELHNFSAAADPVWLERALKVMTKLRSRFDVFHVHANNWDDFTTFANVPFPETLEVSLGNRARYQFEETDERFPTEIDRPNRPNFADLHLGRFQVLGNLPLLLDGTPPPPS